MTSTRTPMPDFPRMFLATAMAAAWFLAASGDRKYADGQEPHRLKLTQAAPHGFPTDRLPAGVSLGPVVPGLAQGGIPQGLSYVPSQNWLVISLHFDNVRPSMLAVVDLNSGKLLKSLTLLEANGSPHFGHVGGLAAGERHLFVASGGLSQRRPNFGTVRQIRNNLWLSFGGVYRIMLEQILKADEVDSVKLQPWFIAESMAGALTLHDQILWVAEFVDSTKQLKIPSHRVIDRNGKERFAWICGYRLNDAGEPRSLGSLISKPLPPDYVLVAPDHVQGIAFFKAHVVLSSSRGISAASTLTVFRDPRANDALQHQVVRSGAGEQIPAWFLDADEQVKSIDLAPMAQNIAAHDKGLALIFESGAEKFRQKSKQPLDYVVLIEPN